MILRTVVRFFASKPPLTLAAWAGALLFGLAAYTVLLPREGFPSVDVPIAIASGTYLVDDAERVDAEIADPLSQQALQLDNVESVQSFSGAQGLSVFVTFEEGITSADGAEALRGAVDAAGLPTEANMVVSEVNAAQFLNEYDLLVAVYGEGAETAEELEAAAATIVPILEGESDVERAEVVELIDEGIDPATGEPATVETGFNLFTTETDQGLEFRPSIAVGVSAADGVDSLAIRDATDAGLGNVEREGALPAGFDAEVAIDFATLVRQQVGDLQSNVLTGVVAVAIVAFLLISWRASVVTALFIMTVLATTMAVLYIVGISINTISLFGVILALGLFVDDAIVITESIVAAKTDDGDDLSIIDQAIARVGTASVSGTVTTLLVFAPMLFISGILGSFIRILPISVIVALIVSLVLSFIFIPLATRYSVLRTRADSGLLTGVLRRIGDGLAGLSQLSGFQGVLRAMLGVGLSLVMIGVGLFVFAPRVGFNIFPPQKDSTELAVEIDFEPGTTIEDARAIALDVHTLAADAIGEDMTQGYLYEGGTGTAFSQFNLTGIGGRDTAPTIVEERLDPIAEAYDGATVTFNQISAGPPEATFPFSAQIYGEDVEVLVPAAEAIQAALEGATIERPNGTTFDVLETQLGFTETISRTDGRRFVELRARFDADDVTTTTASTEDFLTGRFGDAELTALGLTGADSLEFDLGLESDNQESFASLPIAFGVALLSMLVLLIIQFRSIAQWLLVFLAIPFSFFGVFGGLLLTNNVISFFVMLGLIGLIGIAVNNTILLVDYANQERDRGHDRKTAIGNAIRQRFRPLVATSLTTVAGLLPLALSDPFWEGLAFTIIFGLLSSTFLVLVSFPFFYLGIEALRDRFRTPWRRGRHLERTPEPEKVPEPV